MHQCEDPSSPVKATVTCAHLIKITFSLVQLHNKSFLIFNLALPTQCMYVVLVSLPTIYNVHLADLSTHLKNCVITIVTTETLKY